MATSSSSSAKKAAKKTSAKSPAKKKSASKTTAKKAAAKKAPAKKAAKKSSAKKSTAKKAAKKAAAPVKKEAPKTPFDKKFLDEVTALLKEERAKYLASAVSLKAEADALVESREPGDVQFDEESGEGDTLAVERERDLALSAQARQAVQDIDDALQRIEDGTYGICTGSGKPIPKERLRAIPWATQRVEVKAGGFGVR